MARFSEPPRPVMDRRRRRIQLNLSGPQGVLYVLGLLAALTWMFVFGVLVGRGLPVVPPGDDSLKGRLAQFLGLAEEPPAAAEKASATWKSAEEIAQALTFHEDLKGRPDRTEAGAGSAPGGPAQIAAAPPLAVPLTESDSPPPPGGRYVLMVASLRNKDNADSLLAGLKSKGYAPWLEAIQMAEGGLWYRVLLGSFENRQDAQQFAASFNQKERQQALVIQIGN